MKFSRTHIFIIVGSFLILISSLILNPIHKHNLDNIKESVESSEEFDLEEFTDMQIKSMKPIVEPSK